MNPHHSKRRSLFFTPRSPWGGRLESQSFRRHMRASEDSKAGEKKALDQMKEQGENQRKMDQNNVPRSLQAQITPERAGEITHPPAKPPGAAPSLSTMGTNPSPRPQQAAAASGGSGALNSTAQPAPTPAEADKAWMKKEPEKHWYDNPLQYKGWEVIPSVNPHGPVLEFQHKW